MTNVSGKSVVVTGATGLVGAALCRRLLDGGAHVVAVVRDHDPQSPLYLSGDIARVAVVSGGIDEVGVVERAIAQHRPSLLFHLGAQTQVQVALASPLDTWESNVRGTWLTLEAVRRMKQAGVVVDAVVVASSDKAYGDAAVLPYTEETPLHGTFPYDASKACTDIVAHSYAVSYGLNVVVARCGNIFGGGDLNWDRLVPGTIRSLLRGERPVLRSSGAPLRDWIYVDDVVDAYLALAAHAGRDDVRGEAFNFAASAPRDVMSVLRSIVKATGVALEPVVLDNVKGEILHQHLDTSKAKRVLGSAPSTDFDVAMQKTVAWYRTHLQVKA